VGGIALLVALTASAFAQEQLPQQSQNQRKTNTPPPDVPLTPRQLTSELTKDNFERVAATVPQLKAVLAKDTGLMVELKRLIAKDASDNGQVIADEDLTDSAVYQRMVNDIRFRSLATRLVQKYGYLLPSINPESDMGKEQALVLQERAKKFVEIEAQESAEASQKTQYAGQRGQRRNPCRTGSYDETEYGYQDQGFGQGASQYQDPDDPDCTDLGNTRGRGNFYGPNGVTPRNEQQYGAPDQQTPYNPNSLIMRAQAGGAGADLALGAGLIDSSYPTSSDSLAGGGLAGSGLSGLRNGGDSLMGGGGGLDSGQYDVASMDPSRAFALQNLLSGNSQDFSASNNSSRFDMTSNSAINNSRGYRPFRNRELIQPEVVHEPNPYADIPSLYDLYVQAPSRNGTPQRFGSQVFRDGLRNLRAIPMDLPVGPDYVVGPGDSLAIDMWGGVSSRLTRVVDREGRVALPESGPVEVSGRTLGDVQQLVQKTLASQFRDTSADVSVSRLRTVRVYVVGEVNEPGAYDISSLSTALNALVAAGGVTQRGSLRLLKHFHDRQLVETVDAYDLLLRGVTPDAKKLDNGDTLMIPPIGPQVTITGMVRRPAIYELHEEKSLVEALDLAGGILPAATLKHVEVQRLEAHERRTMLSLDLSGDENGSEPQLTSFKVKDGDEIHIFPIAPYNQDTIYLQGHVLRPGKYSYKDGMKLTDIVASYKDLLPEPAPHYGEIIRLNAPDFHPTVESFDLAAAMKDPASAPELHPLDTVRIFGRYDFEAAPIVSVSGEVRSPGTYKTSGQASLRDAVFLAGGFTPNASMVNAQVFRLNPDGTSKIFSVNLGEAMSGSPADNILLQPRDRLLIHRNSLSVEASTVEITGEVAKPGRYPYTGNMRTEDLIGAAGGLKRSADSSKADLTRYAASAGTSQHIEISLASMANGNATEDVPLKGGDVLAIRQVPGWQDIGASIKVGGEVMHPSTYGLHAGEKLSSVLERAGGLTKNAYPYGALLTRREVREVEMKSQNDLISRIKSERIQLKTLPENDQDQKNAKLTAIAETDATLEELAAREPVGRVVIHIQNNIQSWKNTTADLTVRDGDEIFIPKNPSTILVTGQVFNPTAVGIQAGRSAKWYLSQAGGLTPMADRKAVFVIRGDGSVISAKNNSNGWWLGDPLSASLRPGDTVVVPEKALKVGGPNWTTVIQAAQLASSVALTVAAIHP
jgi:protein involved in polysaccharide export with SLBB domain